MKIIYYVNQFFGGIGAEEHAGASLEFRDGALGPAKLFDQLMGDDATVTLTVVCGDNYAVEHQDELTAAVLEKVRAIGADLFAAGPCFDAGRYGMAAGAICTAIQSELGIPAITAMHVENPGVDLYRETLHIVDSGTNIAKMREIVATTAKLGRKLVLKQPVGLPAEEGYISRGLLRDQLVEKTAATRMVDMLVAKLKNEKFAS